MNDEIQRWLVATLQQSKDFVLSQAPSVVQETLGYAVFTSLLLLVICTGTAIAGFVGVRYGRKLYLEGLAAKGNWQEEGLILAVVSGVAGWAATMGALDSLSRLVYVYFFPKAYLLSHFLK